jgi:hypothetical protein
LAQFVFNCDVIRVGSYVVRVWSEHVGWMMGSTPILAWMACLTRVGQSWRLAQIGTVCVLVCMLGDQVWWMMGCLQSRPKWRVYRCFLDSRQVWHSWHSLCLGLHVVGFDHV